MDITVRILEKTEIPAAHEFLRITVGTEFPEYTPEEITYFYTNIRAWNLEKLIQMKATGSIFLGAFVDNQLVGLLITDSAFGGVSFCIWLMVTRKYQRQGVGRKLIHHWEQIAREDGNHNLRLEGDQRNVDYYKKMGFLLIGVDTKGYFGTDNYIFKKQISEPDQSKFLK